MSVLAIILMLIVIGFLLWLINTKIPMQRTIKLILNVFIVILVIVMLLKVAGVWDDLWSFRV